MRGTETDSRKSCSASKFSAGYRATKGPRSGKTARVARAEIARREALVPPRPKRTAAHNRKASGAYSRAGRALDPGYRVAKTIIRTDNRPVASTAASAV